MIVNQNHAYIRQPWTFVSIMYLLKTILHLTAKKNTFSFVVICQGTKVKHQCNFFRKPFLLTSLFMRLLLNVFIFSLCFRNRFKYAMMLIHTLQELCQQFALKYLSFALCCFLRAFYFLVLIPKVCITNILIYIAKKGEQIFVQTIWLKQR